MSRYNPYDNKKQNGYGYNLDNALFRYRTKLASVNQGIVKIGCIGASVTEGYYSGNNDELAWPVRLRESMQTRYGGSDEGFISVKDSDRFVTSGEWTMYDFGTAACVKFTSASAATMTFTFVGTAVDIVYGKNDNGGTATVTIDGGAVASIDCYAVETAMGNLKTYSGLTSESHTVVITAPTDSSMVFIEGAISRKGDTAGIRVDRRGAFGTTAEVWTNEDTIISCFTNNPCDLYVITLGGNDCGDGRTPAQVKADLATIIQTASLTGSIILIPIWQPKPEANVNYPNWPVFQSLYYELADQYNIGVIDLYKAAGNGSFALADGYGLIYSDGIHATVAGQQFIADLVYRYIA